jgi:hypothetical protein
MLSIFLILLPIPQTGFYFNIVQFFPSNARDQPELQAIGWITLLLRTAKVMQRNHHLQACVCGVFVVAACCITYAEVNKWDLYHNDRKIAYVHVINFIEETNVLFIVARH